MSSLTSNEHVLVQSRTNCQGNLSCEESHLKTQVMPKQQVDNKATRGARRKLVTLVMDHWEAWGGFQIDPRSERKADPSPFGTCQALD